MKGSGFMMDINLLDKEMDGRTRCISVMIKIKLTDYLNLAKKAFENGGNINGQRGVIKRSSSASKIRDRMNKDFLKGAVFPPVVLGILVSTQAFEDIENLAIDNPELTTKLLDALQVEDYERVSIIDGMQRSNVYITNSRNNEDRYIRVEVWVALSLVKLLYRMLVLNTGQVPWNLRRQVEVVYKPFLNTLENALFTKYPNLRERIKSYEIDDNGRRVNAGEFHKNQLVELYLAFNLRNEKVEVETQLAEEFHRLDMVEALEKEENFLVFVDIFAHLCELDIALGKIDIKLSEIEGKFVEGKSLFTSHPARVGFVVAATQQILGKIKRDKSPENSQKAYELFVQNCQKLVTKIENIKEVELLREFFAFDFLNEYLQTLPKNKVGDVERKGFTNSFGELLAEEGDINTLEPYWREF